MTQTAGQQQGQAQQYGALDGAQDMDSSRAGQQRDRLIRRRQKKQPVDGLLFFVLSLWPVLQLHLSASHHW